jgi:hypothetical protein
MTAIFRALSENGVDVDALRAKIEDIVRLTVISVQPLLATNYRTAVPWHDGKSRCFEVLGFDILIDKRANPWLLEVNWAPSLATGSPFDVMIKRSVVTGALKIVNMRPNFKRVILNRRKILSQQREATVPGAVFDVSEELEMAEATQYRLIYPISRDHPGFEGSELAMTESKISTVGAAVQPARARARREALMAQIRAREQPQLRPLPASLPQAPSAAPQIRGAPPSAAVPLSVDHLPPLCPEIAVQTQPGPAPGPGSSSQPEASPPESPPRPDSSSSSPPENEGDAVTPDMIASPIFATQAKARTSGKGVAFPMGGRIIAPVPRSRPGRPCPGARPLLVQRMVTQVLAPPPATAGGPTIFDDFAGVSWLVIDEKEEHERLNALKRQSCSAQLISLPERVVGLVHVGEIGTLWPWRRTN